jgi:hypothetical protein
MGLKSSIEAGLSFLGISAMRELLMLLRSKVPEQKSENNLKQSYLMRFHVFFMNSPLNPSGPGAWSLGRSLIT